MYSPHFRERFTQTRQTIRPVSAIAQRRRHVSHDERLR